jgi:hypothetical protein
MGMYIISDGNLGFQNAVTRLKWDATEYIMK